MIISTKSRKPVPARLKFLLILLVFTILFALFYRAYVALGIDGGNSSYLKSQYSLMLKSIDSFESDYSHKELIYQSSLHSLKSFFNLYPSDKDSINISIDFKSWEKIKHERQNALVNAKGFAREFADNSGGYVKAYIEYKSSRIPIKMRLKGDTRDHIKDPRKWSFRIKTRKGKAFKGMRKFSIQHPLTRGYVYEALFHKVMHDLGVISLRYDFIDVSINGESIGVMALEEHFTKEMLEYNERKEGIILKFTDKNMWDEVSFFIANEEWSGTEMMSAYFATLRPYDTNKVADSAILQGQLEIATKMRVFSGICGQNHWMNILLFRGVAPMPRGKPHPRREAGRQVAALPIGY